jgi:hypothetical protein
MENISRSVPPPSEGADDSVQVEQITVKRNISASRGLSSPQSAPKNSQNQQNYQNN